MEQSKKEFLPVLQGVKLSKTQSSTTAKERESLKVVPYALAIGSIQYDMLCAAPDVFLAGITIVLPCQISAGYTIDLVHSMTYFIEPMAKA